MPHRRDWEISRREKKSFAATVIPNTSIVEAELNFNTRAMAKLNNIPNQTQKCQNPWMLEDNVVKLTCRRLKVTFMCTFLQLSCSTRVWSVWNEFSLTVWYLKSRSLSFLPSLSHLSLNRKLNFGYRKHLMAAICEKERKSCEFSSFSILKWFFISHLTTFSMSREK